MLLRIKEIREEKNIKQQDVAKKAGVSLRQIQRWEKNQSYPPVDVFLKIANYLHVDMTYLSGGQAKQEDTAEAALVEHVHQTNLVLIENMEADHRTIKTLARAKVGDLGTDIVRELVQLKDTIGEMIENQIKNERRFMSMVEKASPELYISEVMELDKEIEELQEEFMSLA